jgi:uncharacterized protein YPO0396
MAGSCIGFPPLTRARKTKRKRVDNRTIYHKKYYRIKTLERLRNKIKSLENTLKVFKESPEGVAYFKRISQEYQKEYRAKNAERIKEYRNHYGTF